MPLDSYLGRLESREQASLDLPKKIDRYQKKEQNTAVEVLAAVNGYKHLLFRILLHFSQHRSLEDLDSEHLTNMADHDSSEVT